MAQSMEDENAAFWLPTHFLTDDDFITVKQHQPRNSLFGSDPFDSLVSYNVNDENNTTENDDVFLLTRHLAGTSIHNSHHTTKQNSTSEGEWRFSTSPQSTLSGYGGGWSNAPSRVPSPELQNDGAWDLLYEAAGQVARLKMNVIAAKLNNGLLAPPRHTSAFTTSYDKQYQELKRAQNSNNLARHHHRHPNDGRCNHLQTRSCGGALGVPQSAWPSLMSRRQPLQHHARQSTCGSQLRGIYQGGAGTMVPTLGQVKKQSTGTGVFLPRRVLTSPPRHHHHHHQPQYPEFPKKSAGARWRRLI
ncbi:uncharacterized protein LOC141643072 isoform X2 [Silene latifolia]|uniref:uncharacterized protein LOC141643072 isoform X2 n=1 Tax=Silene latifolia TaxID=37657 RepID=UPI003D7861EB